MKTWGDIVREYVPDATDEEVDYILWERTAYPVASEETVRRHLSEYVDGVVRCDRCDRKLARGTEWGLCPECRDGKADLSED